MIFYLKNVYLNLQAELFTEVPAHCLSIAEWREFNLALNICYSNCNSVTVLQFFHLRVSLFFGWPSGKQQQSAVVQTLQGKLITSGKVTLHNGEHFLCKTMKNEPYSRALKK